jgi:transglutaminase-like putative cysteine protease
VTAPTDVVLSVAVAAGATISTETLTASLDGKAIALEEIADEHGGRLHRANGVGAGRLEVEYRASLVGRAEPAEVRAIDLIRYARPSRYCESDRMSAVAKSEFRELSGLSLLESVSSWVGQRVAYVTGSSRSTDGAVATLLARQGVCRDFAHLVIAMLRSCDMPARLASVYAPGLHPMDFHAVAEAYVDGQWLIADATLLAPRTNMVRIATGRDAADTAFLTSSGESVELLSLDVMAVAESGLAPDDLTQPVQLG